MKKAALFSLFFAINFGGLAIGMWLMNNGPQSNWYLDLNKAPWTPPSWVFGTAWSTIMICFAIYLVSFFTKNYSKKKLVLYSIQVVLNVSWNYVFFNQHWITGGLIILILLTSLIFYFFFTFYKKQKQTSYFLLPYMIWLCVATSLNLYILIYN